ncbi:hypothetical protein S245_048772, partial [Arachis hypogaea]
MASSQCHRFLCIHSLQLQPHHCYHPPFKSPTLIPKPYHCFSRIRIRIAPKASLKNNGATTTTTTNDSVETSSLEDETSRNSSSSDDSFAFLRRFGDGWLKFDELGKEILSIALPAALALAADPLTYTAFVGHIGPVELAAVGVSTSVFNLVSKIFNIPLLNITTSFVAEEQALISKDSSQTDESNFCGKYQSKRHIPSVSTSLALDATLGIAETVLLSLGSGIIMNIMGIPADSPMRGPAETFLMLRAFCAPAIVIVLAAQGTFRGFKDTKTPLYAVGKYLIAFILLWKSTGNVLLTPFHFDGRKIFSYLKSGGLLIGRTVAVFLTLTLSTSMAAKQRPIPMAGHQICMQVWPLISLLTDALALAGQTLLASSYSQGNYEQAGLITYRVLQIGLGTGITLSVILFFGFGSFSSLFTTDLEVLSVARSGILMLVGLVSSMFLLVAAPELGLPGVWAGLFLFMTMHVLAGTW